MIVNGLLIFTNKGIPDPFVAQPIWSASRKPCRPNSHPPFSSPPISTGNCLRFFAAASFLCQELVGVSVPRPYLIRICAAYRAVHGNGREHVGSVAPTVRGLSVSFSTHSRCLFCSWFRGTPSGSSSKDSSKVPTPAEISRNTTPAPNGSSTSSGEPGRHAGVLRY